MLDVSVSNRLDNGKMLVVASDSHKPTNKEYYAVKEENTDRFVKERKSLDFANKFQKSLSAATSIVGGILAAVAVKNNIAKGLVGVASGFGIYKAFEFIDNKLNKKSISNMLKRNDAVDITSEMVNKSQEQ